MTDQPGDGDRQPPYGQSARGQHPRYGGGASPYGPPAYGQPPYGPPAYGQPPYGPPAYGQPPYGPGGYAAYPGYPAPSTDGNAVAALVLSIASFLICPVVLAVVALVFANTAERNIQESGGWKVGQGLATAARIVAWINIGVAVLAAIGLVVGLAALRHSSIA